MEPARGQGRLKGRVAIVTGSGRNIGRAIALAFARGGTAVVVNGHSDRAAVDGVVAARPAPSVRMRWGSWPTWATRMPCTAWWTKRGNASAASTSRSPTSRCARSSPSSRSRWRTGSASSTSTSTPPSTWHAASITANTVAPGHIDPERDWSQYGPREAWTESRRQHIPMCRIGRVEDVAEACVYLAADSGSFVSGQAIHVNGGHYMY